MDEFINIVEKASQSTDDEEELETRPHTQNPPPPPRPLSHTQHDKTQHTRLHTLTVEAFVALGGSAGVCVYVSFLAVCVRACTCMCIRPYICTHVCLRMSVVIQVETNHENDRTSRPTMQTHTDRQYFLLILYPLSYHADKSGFVDAHRIKTVIQDMGLTIEISVRASERAPNTRHPRPTPSETAARLTHD